jgi:PKD repeat protein
MIFRASSIAGIIVVLGGGAFWLATARASQPPDRDRPLALVHAVASGSLPGRTSSADPQFISIRLDEFSPEGVRVLEEENGPAPSPPFGPRRVVFDSPIMNSELRIRPLVTALDARTTGPNDFVLIQDTILTPGPGIRSFDTPEPSVASNNGIVLTTGNWYASLSTNGGRSFGYINPVSAFPSAKAGFCCDQVTTYDASHDTLFWLLQYLGDSTGGLLRLAVAQGVNQAGAKFTYYDFTPQDIGFPVGAIFDFNDLAVGGTSLYLTSNVYGTAAARASDFLASVILSIPLSELAAAGQIHYIYWTETSTGTIKPLQTGGGATSYFAAHSPTIWGVRIFRIQGGSLFYDDVPITPYMSGSGVCPDPNGINWCGKADHRILAAWRTPLFGGELLVAWNASQTTGRPFPYVRLSAFRESDRALIGETDIWSSSNAYQYPSGGVNDRGDVAGTLAYGGGGLFPSTAVFVSDDVSGRSFNALQLFQGALGNTSTKTARWGDFATTRSQRPFSNTWVTVASANTTSASGPEPHFLWVGRRRDQASTPVPTAGFAYSPSAPTTGQSVSFTDASTGSPTSWVWSFGDGSTSALRNPFHSYSIASSYLVSLTVSNSAGSGSTSQQLTVGVAVSAPLANFSFSPAAPVPDHPVQFQDESTGNPNQWTWDFGDPASGRSDTSGNPTPTHTFVSQGSYAVTLTVSNAAGSHSVTKTVTVAPLECQHCPRVVAFR